MGPAYSTGIPYSFQGRTSPNAPSSTLPIFGGSDESFTRGSDFIGEEGSGGDSGSLCFGEGVLFDPFLSTQVGRSDEASHQPQIPQFLDASTALQDGGDSYATRDCSAGRLVGQTGSEGCVLHSPDRSGTSKVPRFVVDQVRYHFTCLPFGLSCAPWAFTNFLKPVAALLRGLGVHLIVYIDDMLVIGKSPAETRDHVEALIVLLEGLGFIINREKSVLTPSQQIEFLGFRVDTSTMSLSLPGHKIRTIRGEAIQLL